MPDRIIIRQVETATQETTEHVGSLLATAFDLDPITLPILGGNRTLAPQHMRAHFKCAVVGGIVHLASFSTDDVVDDVDGEVSEPIIGAALWYGPGQEFFGLGDKVPERRLADAQLSKETLEWKQNVFFPQYKALTDTCLGQDRRRDLYYLHVLGVHPSARRRGVASALVRHGLEIADKEGVEVALETNLPSNIKMYESFGFKALGQTTITSPHGDITVTCMLRPVGGRPVLADVTASGNDTVGAGSA